MNLELRPGFLKLFFAVCACSWMPHWACHYYRLETGSNFVVGSWVFSPLDSFASLFFYTLLIALNLAAIQIDAFRIVAAALSAIGHLIIGSLHVYRLVNPFRFEVFGYSWSYGASLREAIVVLPVGLAALAVAILLKIKNRTTGGTRL